MSADVAHVLQACKQRRNVYARTVAIVSIAKLSLMDAISTPPTADLMFNPASVVDGETTTDVHQRSNTSLLISKLMQLVDAAFLAPHKGTRLNMNSRSHKRKFRLWQLLILVTAHANHQQRTEVLAFALQYIAQESLAPARHMIEWLVDVAVGEDVRFWMAIVTALNACDEASATTVVSLLTVLSRIWYVRERLC